jgi:hypothetical protein
MAFQATGYDGPVEMKRAIRISRTVRPLAERRPIGYGQLKEIVPFPIEISLRFTSRTNHYIDALGKLDGMGGVELIHSRNRIAVLGGAHPEKE